MSIWNIFRVRRGDPPRAIDHNSIVAVLERALRVQAGGGINATWDQSGLRLWLAAITHEWILPGRILEAHGPSEDSDGVQRQPAVADSVTYTAGALDRYQRLVDGTYTGMVLRGVRPSFGRPVKGSEAALHKIRPAEVGAMCLILRDKDVEGITIGRLALLPGGSDGETSFMQPCPNP